MSNIIANQTEEINIEIEYYRETRAFLFRLFIRVTWFGFSFILSGRAGSETPSGT